MVARRRRSARFKANNVRACRIGRIGRVGLARTSDRCRWWRRRRIGRPRCGSALRRSSSRPSHRGKKEDRHHASRPHSVTLP
jgi:hypothetical protein